MLALIPTDQYEQAWQAMPEYTSHHVGFVSRLALPGKWEPEDLCAYLLVFRETPDPGQELIRLFIERLKECPGSADSGRIGRGPCGNRRATASWFMI